MGLLAAFRAFSQTSANAIGYNSAAWAGERVVVAARSFFSVQTPTECNKHIRYLTLILFDFGVADSVKGNQPGNKIFLRGRSIPLVM